MKKFLILICLLAGVAHAAPFVVTDPVDPSVTHCGVFVNAAAKVVIPVTPATAPQTGNICKFDLAAIPAGNTTITLTAIAVDPVQGTFESAKSLPLVFTRLGAPSVPAGLKIIP